jgi:glutamate 5-kinase
MIRIEDIQGTGRSVELRRVVIKLGSAVVAAPPGVPAGTIIDEPALAAVADAVARLRAEGVRVMLVSSGAIAMGRGVAPAFVARTIPDRQALAAIGQVGLMHVYKKLFNARGFLAAQVLLTREDMETRRRYLNARYTLDRLLDLGAVPVINENDTVTVDELKFGDNDELSALVATKMEADLLIILSVIDGLFAADPTRKGSKKRGSDSSALSAPPAVDSSSDSAFRIPHSALRGTPIPAVEKIDEAVHALAARSRSAAGIGGMATKLQAMQIATRAGVHGIIAGGKTPGMIEAILTGRFTGTYFAPAAARKLSGRLRWIAFGRRAKGRLIVDAGARDALVDRKKSLLAAGITAVEGDFEKGDLVEIAGPGGDCLARGLVNYSSEDIEKIRGKKTSQIPPILGAMDYPEVVHRDNLAMQE